MTLIVPTARSRWDAKRRSASRACQRSVAAAGRMASDTKRSRPSLASPSTVTMVRGDAEPLQQGMHRVLRMPHRGLVLRAADQRPRFLVEVGVEAGKHDGAVRQARDGREQRGGCRHRAGRARGDDGPLGVREPRGLRRDQAVAARGRLDRAALLEDGRPCLPRDLQEFQRELPIFVDMIGHQAVEAIPRHLPCRHVVDEPSEIVGKRERGGRAGGDEGRAALRAHLRRRPPTAARGGRAARGARARRARAEGRARPRRCRRSRPRRTRSRPRRCRRWRRCAGGSRRRRTGRRERPRAQAGRRAASAETASPPRARADRAQRAGPAAPSIMERITVGRNGTEAGMVKRRNSVMVA